jgi:hypothetical protein
MVGFARDDSCEHFGDFLIARGLVTGQIVRGKGFGHSFDSLETRTRSFSRASQSTIDFSGC